MAGILPGVECARRRRFHQTDPYSSIGPTTNINGRTRRYSFCLYTSSSNDTHPNNHFSSTSSSLKRSISNLQKTMEQDEKLEGVVREAKERLHEKLRSQSYVSSSSISVPNKRSNINKDEVLKSVVGGHLEKEVVGLKKKACNATKNSLSKRTFMSWARFGWKSSSQEVCAVCNF